MFPLPGGDALALVRVLTLSPEVVLESVERRRGIVGGDGLGEVQIVDHVPVPVQVVPEARLPLTPHRFVNGGMIRLEQVERSVRWRVQERRG